MEALETIANNHIIPFLANVAKALVTLAVLATKDLIKLSYLAAIFATNRVVANNREQDIKGETANPSETLESKAVNYPVSIPITDKVKLVDNVQKIICLGQFSYVMNLVMR